jgi:hypothetical protein
MVSEPKSVSRSKSWQDKFSHICQEIRDIKKHTRNQFSINSIENNGYKKQITILVIKTTAILRQRALVEGMIYMVPTPLTIL